MIVIPNMEKPKECKECQWHLDFYIEDEQVGGLCTITEKDDRENTCPLIEIVTCGECKHMRKYALRSDEPTGIWCHRWSVPRLVTDDDFCSYGERRADERLYKER